MPAQRENPSMTINSNPIRAGKRRRLSKSGRDAAPTRPGARRLVKNGSLPKRESAGPAVHLMQKLELPVKALSSDECTSFLESLERTSRQRMDVVTQTTMTFQRFLNAGMMAKEELSQMHSMVEALSERRDWRKNPRVVFINATELGGGVAEMRLDTIALFRDLNFKAEWLVMDGADRFYKVTVHVHEGIQNPNYTPLEPHEIETFHLTTIANFLRLEQDHPLSDIDVLWIDDPQPLGLAPLVKMLYPDVLVIWRCHVHVDAEPSIGSFIKDLTSGNLHPERDHLLINFLKARGRIVSKTPPVDIQVFHREVFATNLDVPLNKAHIMPPCINPLSFKNMDLNDSLIRSTLVKYGIMPGPRAGRYSNVPPYVLEVSRYDPYKGPLELITAFRKAVLNMPLDLQREIRLVLVSSLPGDNPSGVRLARILQEFVDSLDLSEFPEDQRADGPNDLRKRIHLLMLDDKAPWERVLDRLQHFRHMSFFSPDRVSKIAREMRELARLPIHDAVAKLQHCGLITSEVAAHLAADPLPNGVSLTAQQKFALLDVLETRKAGRRVAQDPGGTPVTLRNAERDSMTGKEINAFEVNALQSGALVTVQFSSKEGFGLTVSESLVKAVPGYEGVTVCTLVGGIIPQAEACDCFSIEYPPAEVAESLTEYRSLPDHPDTNYLHSLAARIEKRSSVVKLVKDLETGATMPKREIERRSRAARKGVLENFSTWVNVHNILRAMGKAAKFST
mmetsp:Transcript_14206/g.25008  ORF Transcript_14206/g.25008 Transcript_14206/m.25008 type:complete len:735 (-) Transcript_14206:158-2362(-)